MRPTKSTPHPRVRPCDAHARANLPEELLLLPRHQLKIANRSFKMESTIRRAAVLLGQHGKGFPEPNCPDKKQANELQSDRPDDVRDSFKRFFIFRYDERFESNRDARVATSRESLLKSANSRQADCEPIRTASRAGPNEMG